MKYIAHEDKQGPDGISVQEGPVPIYDKDNEVLIKVEACAANRADLLQSRGQYPPPPGVTKVIGLECAGYVVDPKTNVITDRRVMALLSGGGYAQFAKVHKDHVIDIPEELSFETAACIPEKFLTSYQILHKIADIQEDETVLILAGASGIGTSMIQLCNYAGASSIAISSSDAKLEQCKKIGAYACVNYKQYPSFSDRVQLFTDGEGVDVVTDPVMGNFFNCTLDCLGYDSRWIIYGFMGGIKIKEANMMKLLNKRASILTSTLRNRSDEYKTELVTSFAERLMPGFVSGELAPIIYQTINLSDSKHGLEMMAQNRNTGNIAFINDL
jgi:tumor protein p53-inducible protein 3